MIEELKRMVRLRSKLKYKKKDRDEPDIETHFRCVISRLPLITSSAVNYLYVFIFCSFN